MKTKIYTLSILSTFIFVININAQKKFSKKLPYYINLNYIVKNYEKTKQLGKFVEQKEIETQTKIDSLVGLIKSNSIMISFAKDGKKLHKKEVNTYSQWAYSIRRQIKPLQKEIDDGFAVFIAKKENEINIEINNFLQEFGNKHNIWMILGAVGNGNLMFANKKTNLTHIILKELNNTKNSL
jgi:Skp family chaperone for outer membrane proteins